MIPVEMDNFTISISAGAGSVTMFENIAPGVYTVICDVSEAAGSDELVLTAGVPALAKYMTCQLPTGGLVAARKAVVSDPVVIHGGVEDNAEIYLTYDLAGTTTLEFILLRVT